MSCCVCLCVARGVVDERLCAQLKAIEELKDKQKKGERLEATQLKKIETETEIRKELEGLNLTS